MNFLKKRFNSIKICAVFTTICFVVSTLGANLYAIPMAEKSNKQYEDVFNKASSISNEYGKITASKDANSDITVINIQDLHCHPQTQRNISKIIGQIADKYNLKSIYVEGGYGNIDTSWLNQIKDENIRKQVIERLVEDGILTGSEYYKLTSKNETVELKGIDEEKLHQDNIKRLSLIIENQDKYKELSRKINKEINFLEQRYVNVRNKRFNVSIEEYLSNKIDTKRFYRQLIKYVKDINTNPDIYNNVTAIKLEDYPNISKFMTLRKVSKNINVREVTQQLQIVLNELKSRLPYNVYTKLLKETENFSDSQKVVELISLLCDKEGINLDSRYKSLSEFLKSNDINRDLNAVELVYEERQLITEIRKALSYNNEEYEITFVSDFSRYFQDYLEYKLTDADWKYFETGYETFRQLYGKYATVDRINEIENDIAELNKYYEINDRRNEIFVDNLLRGKEPSTLNQSKLRQDEEILKNSKEIIIAVTGGFHSQALEEILQAKEVNTIVITPSIFEGIEKATKQYKGIIKEQSKEFQHQALAYKILSCSDTLTKRAIMYGVLKSLLNNNPDKLREFFGDDVDLNTLETEFQNLQENDQFQNEVSVIKKILDIETESLLKVLPIEGGKIIFSPDIDKLLMDISLELIDIGIFLSDGVIFDIENSVLNGRDLKNIPAEVYSRMHSELQKALFESEYNSLSEEDKVIKRKRTKTKNKTKVEEYTPQPNATKEQILMNLVQNNKYYYEKLSNLVIKYNLDIEKDIRLLNVLAANMYFDDNVLDRIVDTVKKYNINTDLKYEILVNYVVYFQNESTINSLFSLNDENLEFLFNIYTYEDVIELEILLGLDNLDDRLNKFKGIYVNDFNLDLGLLNVSKFTIFMEEVDKIQNISKESLKKLTLLDYYAISYILKNVSNSLEIEHIFEYADKFNLSSQIVKIGDSEIDEEFKDIRYKAVIQYIDLDNEELFRKLFDFESKTLKVIVDSISDTDFLKDYLLNDNKYFGDKTYFEIYSELLENINSLNFRKIAVDNNYLALKLLVDKEFNDAVSEKLLKTDNIISKYFVAIFVSRFIYDSLNYEVFNYDMDNEEFKSILQKALNIYSALLNEMGKISVFSKQTKIYALCNNEILADGKRRFNTEVFEEILGNFQREPDITSFDRAENANASNDWLDSFRNFGLYSDDPENETGYFVFMGHGGKDHLQTVTPRYNKIFRGEIIRADVSSESEFITAEQMADALFDLAIRQENKVDLRNITIDLSACHSYSFARKVYSLLDKKYSEYKKENKDFVGTFPIIITATGLETELTYTIFSQNINNFHDAVINTLRNGKIEEYTLDMLATSEYQIHESNITMFVSYNNPDIKNMIDDVRKDIKEFFEKEKNKDEQQSNVKEKALEGVSPLSEDVVESSILRPFGVNLADKAHIWEEIVFRYLPTAAILLGFINPFIGLAMQVLFILAHPVAKWIAARTKGNKVGIKDLFKQIGKDIKNLSLPTFALILPYIGSLLALSVAPVLELLISPVLFMFSDVIVKWITKKDSGRKVTLDTTTGAVAIISSVLSFVLATSLPIISPLINPIVITNTIKAGYLHYQYNKKQKDSGKLLKIGNKEDASKNTAEYLKKIKVDDNVKNKIQKLCNIKNIDLLNNVVLQDLLFNQSLCYQSEEKLKILFDINLEDENYDIKCQIMGKYIYDIDPKNDRRTVDWLLSLTNKDLLTFIFEGVSFSSIDLDYYFLGYDGKNKYSDEDFAVLGKFSQELELLLSLSQNQDRNIDLLTDILDNREKIEVLDSEEFNEFFFLYVSDGRFPFFQIIGNIKTGKELKKYINLIKEYDLFFDEGYKIENGSNVYMDYRWKLALKCLDVEENIKGEIFKYLLKKDFEEENKREERYKNTYLLFNNFPISSKFFKEYLFNDKYKKTYKKLLDTLIKFKFRGIASENDFFALKLLVNEDFNKMLDDSNLWDLSNMSEDEILVARYYSAIAISRFIYDSVGSEIKDYNFSSKELKEQIEKITELYIKTLKMMGSITLIDSHTKIYGLCNDEQTEENTDRFNNEAIEKMLEILNIDVKSTVYKRKDNPNAANDWLASMENLVLETDEEKAYFVFRGHGIEYDGKNILEVKNKQSNKAAEVITAEDMADALFNLATRNQNPVDLKRVTIDLSCCYSYFFARKVYEILKQKYEAKGIKGTYPTIITAAGLETETGFTSPKSENEGINNRIGNLHEGILKVLKEKQTSAFTLDMLALSEYQFRLSNITMFASFGDEMTKEIERLRENTNQIFSDYSVETQTKKSEQQTIQEDQETVEVKEDTVKRIKIPALFGGIFEASIFSNLESKDKIIDKLSKYAHIWEEINFRAIPALLASFIIFSFGIFLASTGILGSVFVAYFISAIPGLFVFVLAQKKFIEAHIIEDWIKTQNLSNRQKWILRVFGRFPSKQLKENFKSFYKEEENEIKRESITTATATLAIPYLISIVFTLFMPFVPVIAVTTSAATITAQVLHYKHNEITDIKKELIDLSLSISNNFTQITENPIVQEQKQEAIKAFEHGINKLKEELLDDKRNLEDELEKIREKTSLTDEDNKKIEDLKYRIERITQILGESFSRDITLEKLLANIDRINGYEQIFKDLELLADRIAKYYGPNKQELEKIFLNLVENSLCERLMDLYYDDVTKDHVKRVMKYSIQMYSYSNPYADIKDKYNFMIGALMHDIGKNLVPDEILNKEGRLTDEELKVMQRHVLFGRWILKYSILKDFSSLAENHHVYKADDFVDSEYKERANIESEKLQEMDDKAQLCKLTDIFQAVSPYIVRPYQYRYFPRDIKKILLDDSSEAIRDIKKSEKGKEIIEKLLFEIDEIEKQSADINEQQELILEIYDNFVEKIMYSQEEYDEDIMMKIRKEKRKAAREKSFSIICSDITPKEIFKFIKEKDGLSEEEFIRKFKEDSEYSKKAIEDIFEFMKSKVKQFGFEEKYIRAFLKFYFNEDDISIDNERIITSARVEDSVPKRFFISNLLRTLKQIIKEKSSYKLDIFEDSESDKTETEQSKSDSGFNLVKRIFKSKKDDTQQKTLAKVNAQDYGERKFVISSKDGNTYVIALDVYSADIKLNLDVISERVGDDIVVSKDKRRGYQVKLHGIKRICMVDELLVKEFGITLKMSEDEKTVYIVKTDDFKEGTQIYPLSEQVDIPSQNIQELSSVEFEPNINFSDAELETIIQNSGATRDSNIEKVNDDVVNIYLDDYTAENIFDLKNKIKKASDNNKLIVIHFFRNNNSQSEISYSQVFSKFEHIRKIIRLFSFYERESNFFIDEILKNAFVHGNLCHFEEPIALYIKLNDENTKITKLAVYNKDGNKEDKNKKENIILKSIAVAVGLAGHQSGADSMIRNKNYDYNFGTISLSFDSEKFSFYKASVTSEKDKNIVNIEDIIDQDVVFETKSGEPYILHFNSKSFHRAGRGFGFDLSPSVYGIKEVRYDENGNIVGLVLEEGTKISSKKIDGEIQSSEDTNLSFSLRQEREMLKDAGVITDEEESMEDKKVEDYIVKIYLDDENFEADMEDAIKNNKLMVIHIFRNGVNTQSLPLWQLYERYKKAYELLQSNKLKNIPSLSETIKLEQEVETDSTITFDFFLKEILKNHFGHGNSGLFEYPIACYIAKDGSEMVTYDSALDLDDGEKDPFSSEEFKEKNMTRNFLAKLMYDALISGDGKGRKMMKDSLLRILEDGRIKINGLSFYRAKVSLKLKTEEQKEAAKQYKKEHERQTVASPSITSTQPTAEDWADFWGAFQTKDTLSILYDRGFAKYLKQYLKKTGKKEQELTDEERILIREQAENYHFTLAGIVYGVWLEKFALFSKGFIAAHGEMSFGMKIVVWTIRALSIGIGLTTAILSFSALPFSTLFLTAVSPAIFGSTTIFSGFVIHLLWNVFVALTKNQNLLLQARIRFSKRKDLYSLDREGKDIIFNVSRNVIGMPAQIMNIIDTLATNKTGIDVVKNNEDIIKYLNLQYGRDDIVFDLQKNLREIRQQRDILVNLVTSRRNFKKISKKRHKTKEEEEFVRQVREWEDQLTSEKLIELYVMNDKIIPGNVNSFIDDEIRKYEKKLADIKEEREKEVERYYLIMGKNIPRRIIDICFKAIDNPESFNEKDHRTIHNYINDVNIYRDERRTKQESKEREQVIKFFSVIYARQTWQKFVTENAARLGYDGISNIENFEINLGNDQKLTLERWIHICDGHSILINGNERDGKDRYLDSEGKYSSKKALDSVITLDKLCDNKTITNIIESYDVRIYNDKNDGKFIYIKRIDNLVYVYVTKENYTVTCYVIDGDSYSYNMEAHILETIAISKDNIITRLQNNFVEETENSYIIEAKVDRNLNEIRGRNVRVESNSLYLPVYITGYDSISKKFTFSADRSIINETQIVEELIRNKEITKDDAQEYLDLIAAILPENMGFVNKMLQQGRSALAIATTIAFKEFGASLEPNFVDLHKTAVSRQGAQQVASLANRYNITKEDAIVTKIIKSILGIIFKGVSIVKHIAIDYRYIKASGIQEAINMFGKDAKLLEDGQIEVAIVEDIELLQDSFTLVNTGLKVDGASIYRIKDTSLLIYGAKGQSSIKVVKTLDGSDLLNKDIVAMLKANGEKVDEVETQGIVTKKGDGISVSDEIIEIGEMELSGKDSQQIKQFVASALEIKRVMGIMYGQKTIIDLKSVTDEEKLKVTVYNGRARKVISKAQYKTLNLTEVEIEQLKQKGIEIYIDNGTELLSETEIKDYKNKGIAGQIIRDKEGVKIKDYSTEEETKIEEILEDQNIESKILNAETSIMIGIDILTKHFRQGNITAVQREFGALLGKIKMSLNLGKLNSNDIEYMGYNINFNRIPILTQDQINKMFEKVGNDLQIVDKDRLIEIIGPETEFAIILKTIKDSDAENRFKNIAVERILAKYALTEKNKEFGLKDKNLEVLLGKMLLAQVNNTDKEQTNISDDFKGSMDEVMKKIKEETEKAMQKDEVAINTIIELILVYGDSYKNKQMARELDKNDARNYRAMMAAA